MTKQPVPAERSTTSQKAAARFFIRIGQVGRAAEPQDRETLPLFSLPLIMNAEGVLSDEAAHLV